MEFTSNHPVTIVSWSEFINSPSIMHGLFRDTPGALSYNPNQVRLLVGTGNDPDSKASRTLNVETVEDLISVRNDVMSKPLVWQTTLRYRQRKSYVIVRVSIVTKGTFAVLLNTRHPAVAARINPMFDQARESILRGEKFCLEIDLTECLEYWYENLLRENDLEDCGGYTRSRGTHVYITNKSPYQHCFDCNRTWAFSGCLCWLLSAPCYLAVRACTTKDMACYFDRDTPIVYRTTTRTQGQFLEILDPRSPVQVVGPAPVIEPPRAPVYSYGSGPPQQTLPPYHDEPGIHGPQPYAPTPFYNPGPPQQVAQGQVAQGQVVQLQPTPHQSAPQQIAASSHYPGNTDPNEAPPAYTPKDVV